MRAARIGALKGSLKMMLRTASLFASLLLAISIGSAQEQRGLITGIVSDQQGAMVPNATVTVKDNGTGAIYTGATTGEGAFTIPGLPFGSYSVTIVAQGFRKWETKSVQVITAQESNVRATLEVGSSTETVTVES